jgi:putative DNA primase/helicase
MPLEAARELIKRSFTEGGVRVLHHQSGQFYQWVGTHYVEAPNEEVRACAYAFLDTAKHRGENGDEPFNPTRSRVADVVEALRAEGQLPRTVRAPAWIGPPADNQPPAGEILACSNGLLHLPTRHLLQLTPRFFAINAINYAYEPRAPEPAEWLQFLTTIWPDDPRSIETLQELFGLLLTAETRHQKIFLIVGPKRSGKGTIGRVLTAMLGRENVCNPTLAGIGQNFGLAPFIGKPLAMIADARLGGRTDPHIIAERLLSISGEDGQTIDRKFMSAWTGTLPTRFVVLTNELPRLTDASGALAGRFIIMQMTRSFYGHEDLGLTDRLLPELPGILNWAIAGLDRLNARGFFVQPDSAQQAIEELEDLASPVGAFVKACCLVGPEHSVGCDNLYAQWTIWCSDQHRNAVGTKTSFGRDLRAATLALAIHQVRMPDGERVREYQGIGLKFPD